MIRWIEPEVCRIAEIFHNPAYAGTYAFRRRVTDPSKGRDPRGHVRSRKATPDEVITTRGHHDGYISEAQFDEIQEILRLNAPSKNRRNLGRGSALLQGITRCGIHRNWKMCAIYYGPRQDGGHSHAYKCNGDCTMGGDQCGRINGDRLDRAVVAVALARLQPPRIELVREAWRHARAGERAEHIRVQLEVSRSRHRVDDLELRYLSVDPSNRLVARDLERKLEAAKRDLAHLERATGSTRSPVYLFDEASFDELVQLCSDLRTLWDAQTTNDQDRKQMLRTMIEDVIIVEKNLERAIARIMWADGAPDTLVEIKLNRQAHAIIVMLEAEGTDPEQIAARLNEEDVPTSKGRSWTRRTVAQYLKRGKRTLTVTTEPFSTGVGQW